MSKELERCNEMTVNGWMEYDATATGFQASEHRSSTTAATTRRRCCATSVRRTGTINSTTKMTISEAFVAYEPVNNESDGGEPCSTLLLPPPPRTKSVEKRDALRTHSYRIDIVTAMVLNETRWNELPPLPNRVSSCSSSYEEGRQSFCKALVR